jgi:hypothetical protein
MPTYRWSCLACGTANAASSFECASCGCPGRATLDQMQEHRLSYQQRGGVVGINAPALYQERPFQASRLALAVLCALLFWYIPRRLR